MLNKILAIIFLFTAFFVGNSIYASGRNYDYYKKPQPLVSGTTELVDKTPSNFLVKIKNQAEYTPKSLRDSHRTLVILIKFLDTQNIPFTNSEAKNLVFNSQFDKFMKEQSFGKVDFEGDVFGWLTINKMASDGCEIDHEAVNQFAIANNINLKNYDHYINILNCDGNTANGFSTVGKVDTSLGNISASVSVTSIYLSLNSALAPSYHVDSHIMLPFVWRNLDAILSHEMGHALGLGHARGWDCYESQASFPCDQLEYGNSFDVMANLQALSLHTNAFYKKQLGWIGDDDVVTISQSGIYKLSPIEIGQPVDPSLPSPLVGKRLAVIKLPGQDNSIYAIERRTNFGFDSQLSQGNRSGFYIYKVENNAGLGTSMSLIDTTPSPEGWPVDVLDASLNDEPFSDSGAGLTIAKVSASEFKVIITPAVCTRIPPKIQSISKIDGFGTKALRTIVNNTDFSICPKSNFVTEILPNSVLSGTVPINGLGIFANSQFAADLIYTVSPGVPPGIYPIEVKTTNLDSGLSDVGVFNISVTESCAFYAPTMDMLEVLNTNTLSFTVTNKNTSPCFATDFLTEIIPNPIISELGSQTNELVGSGEGFSGVLHFQLSPNTPPGTYQIVVKSTDLDSGLFVKKSVDYTVF